MCSRAPRAQVLGSGIAGLTYALDMAEHGSVAVVSKDVLQESNTQYAQVRSPGPPRSRAGGARERRGLRDVRCDRRAVHRRRSAPARR